MLSLRHLPHRRLLPGQKQSEQSAITDRAAAADVAPAPELDNGATIQTQVSHGFQHHAAPFSRRITRPSRLTHEGQAEEKRFRHQEPGDTPVSNSDTFSNLATCTLRARTNSRLLSTVLHPGPACRPLKIPGGEKISLRGGHAVFRTLGRNFLDRGGLGKESSKRELDAPVRPSVWRLSADSGCAACCFLHAFPTPSFGYGTSGTGFAGCCGR